MLTRARLPSSEACAPQARETFWRCFGHCHSERIGVCVTKCPHNEWISLRHERHILRRDAAHSQKRWEDAGNLALIFVLRVTLTRIETTKQLAMRSYTVRRPMTPGASMPR